MTIKTLRKSYENLTMLQRFSLFDNAISRDDESEAEAIIAASPRKTYSQPDYCDLFEQISKIRYCNLIFRLGHMMTFYHFLEIINEKLEGEMSPKEDERFCINLRIAAFLYVRATDSWNLVNNELSLRTTFDTEIGEILYSIDLLQSKDAMMRELAFTEDEARAYLLEQTGSDAMKTIEDEVEGYREYLGLKAR